MVTVASIQTAIQLNDNFTRVANNIIAATNMMISTMEDADRTMNSSFDATSISAIKGYMNQAAVAAEQLNSQVNQVGNEISNNISRQDKFSNSIKKSTNSAGNLVKTIMGLSAFQTVVSTVKNQLNSALERMDTMTNFERTMTSITGSSSAAEASLSQLKDMTTGTAYGLDTAAKSVQNFTTRGMNMGFATAEVGKWADAVAFYGDGTNETLSSVTDALGKMMTKGKVEMDQLDRLTDAGINAVGIYAQATGSSAAKAQESLSAGKISSIDFITTVSSAFTEGTNGVLNISGAAKKAGDTWGTSIANMKAAITRGLVSMIDNINEGMEKAGFGTVLDQIRNLGEFAEKSLGKIGTFIGDIIVLAGPLIEFIREHNEEIMKAVEIVTSLAIAYSLVSGAISLVTTVITICQTAMALFGTAAGAAFGIGTILAIAGVAAGIYSIIQWVKKLNNKTGDMGETMELVFKKIEVIVLNAIAKFAEFTQTFRIGWNVMCLGLEIAFRAVAGVVLEIVYVIADTVRELVNGTISIINAMIDSLNSIPGVSIGRIQEVAWTGIDDIGKMAQDQFNAIYSSTLETDKKNQEIMDDTYDKQVAAKKAQAEYDKLYKKYTSNNKSKGKDDDEDENLTNIDTNTNNTAANTANIAKTLSATSEQLKYIRDIAEQKYINRFTTAQITVNQTNHNTVNNDMDLDGVTEHLRSTMEEQMAAAAEGVH